MITAIAFAVFAAAGTLVRLGLLRRLPVVVGGVPVATLIPNVVGSFLLGLLVGSEAPTSTVVGVGGLGALTTFSRFVSESAGASRRAAGAIVASTVVASVGSAWIGLRLAG